MNAGPAAKRERQRTIRDIITAEPIGSQQELADRLTRRGFTVTQATVSRDIAELGLVKVARDAGHRYVATQDVAGPPPRISDERLRRILADIPVTIGRSGLVLLVTGSPGTASVIAGGMVPKIRAALAALTWDGAEAVIADASADGALERALADPTFGTRITASRRAVGAA